MHYSVGGGHLDVLRFLLDVGVDKDQPTRASGSTPLHFEAGWWFGTFWNINFIFPCHIWDNPPTIGELTPSFFKMVIFCTTNQAVTYSQLEIARFLVDNGANWDPATDSGDTPLHLAASNGSLEIARLLIEAGANKDQRRTEDGSTPLHVAAEEGHLDLVRLLIESGADSEITTDNLATALDLASGQGHAEVVTFLAGEIGKVKTAARNQLHTRWC